MSLLTIFIIGTLVGCAPPKDKPTHENSKRSEENKDKKIKIKVADEEDDKKEKKKK